MTVAELIEQLRRCPPDEPAQLWVWATDKDGNRSARGGDAEEVLSHYIHGVSIRHYGDHYPVPSQED